MRAFVQLTWTEMKLFLREPAAFFFTLIFPLISLFVFGSIFGNKPDPHTHFGPMDYSVPGYVGMIMGTTALIGLPTVLASYREQGILRRLQLTPVHPMAWLWAQILVQTSATTIGSLLLVIAGRLVYGLKLPEAPASLILAFLLGTLSLCSLGFVLGSLLPTARGANAAGMAIFFPMMFLSGAAMPRQFMPERVQQIGEYLPLKHAISLLANLWYGDGWDGTALAVLTGMLVLGAVLTAKLFRWRAA